MFAFTGSGGVLLRLFGMFAFASFRDWHYALTMN
jgi:hypothetical protein